MAAAKILGGGTLHHRCPCVTLPTKPYSRPSKLLYSTFIHSQPTKIRAFSVRACGRVDNDVRKRPIDGITIGDVASKDSFSSYQAQKALQALVVDTNGRLQVWDDGVFHKNIALKLLSIKFESLLEKGKATDGNGLFDEGFVFYYEGNVLGVVGSLERCQTVCSCLFGHHFEFFSRAFGIGDPNQGIEEKRWKMIGQYIALNGSVVTAEEITPYLDHETTRKMDDDSYMLPVLQKFDGQPKVDEEGNILYHFPSVHCSPLPRTSSREKEYAGRWVDRIIKVDKFLEEHQWEFSELEGDSLDYIFFLLRYNLFSALFLRFVLRATLGWELYYNFCFTLLLMYAIYALSFLVISLTRRSSITKRNTEIVKRNKARKERAKSLESPDHAEAFMCSDYGSEGIHWK